MGVLEPGGNRYAGRMTPLNLLDSATPYGGSDRALIWRELRWVERQPVLKRNPSPRRRGSGTPAVSASAYRLPPVRFLGCGYWLIPPVNTCATVPGTLQAGHPVRTRTPQIRAQATHPAGCLARKEHASAAVNNANDAPPATSSRPFTPRTCTPAH